MEEGRKRKPEGPRAKEQNADRYFGKGRQRQARLWRLAYYGEAFVIFPDGTILRLGVEDWIGVNKFIYQHIDGPPKAELDITSAGEQLFIKMDQ
jgi:hypothetical protein